MTSPALGRERNYGLDVVRSAAIILVLLSHGRHLVTSAFPFLKEFFVFGYVGVEIFFVLSGFLIGGILTNILKPGATFQTVKNFWIRRWFRTLPNYWLFLGFEIVVAILLRPTVNLWKFVAYPFFLQTFYYPIRPVYYSVSWSLAVEEWFYLTAPVLLLVATFIFKKQRASFFSVIGLFLFASLAARYFYALSLNANWGPDIRNTTILRMDSIAFGLLGALVYSNWRPIWDRLKHSGFTIGMCSLIANLVYLQVVDPNTSIYCKTLQFTVVPASVLLCFPYLHDLASPAPIVRRVIETISMWSYSLYLCHMMIKDGLEKALGVLFKKLPDSFLIHAGIGIFTFIAFIVISCAISAVVFRFYETPMTKMRERFSKREKHTV